MRQPNEVIYENGNHTLVSAMEPPPATIPCPWTCELTNDVGYVVYSALGSFYIPMFVMLFFYWRIYMAAVRTTRAIRQGFKTTKGKKNPFPCKIKKIMSSVVIALLEHRFFIQFFLV
jgi:hypothetical protein